jgi:hypothetical protein
MKAPQLRSIRRAGSVPRDELANKVPSSCRAKSARHRRNLEELPIRRHEVPSPSRRSKLAEVSWRSEWRLTATSVAASNRDTPPRSRSPGSTRPLRNRRRESAHPSGLSSPISTRRSSGASPRPRERRREDVDPLGRDQIRTTRRSPSEPTPDGDARRAIDAPSSGMPIGMRRTGSVGRRRCTSLDATACTMIPPDAASGRRAAAQFFARGQAPSLHRQHAFADARCPAAPGHRRPMHPRPRRCSEWCNDVVEH